MNIRWLTFKELKSCLKPHTKHIVLLFVLNVIPLSLLNTYVYGIYIEKIITQKQAPYIFPVFLAFSLITAITVFLNIIKTYTNNKVGFRLSFLLKNRVFRNILRKDFDELESENQEKLKNIIEQDTGTVHDFIQNQIISYLITLINIIMLTVILILINWYYFLIMIAINAILFIVKRIVARHFARFAEIKRQVYNHYNNIQFGYFQNIKEVKNSNLFNVCETKFKNFWADIFNIEIKTTFFLFLTWIMDDLSVYIVGQLISFILGIALLSGDNLSFGIVIIFSGYFLQLINNINSLIDLETSLKSSRFQYNNLTAYLKKPLNNVKYLNSGDGDISIENLSFKYDTDENNVIDGFTYNFKKNSSVVLIGKSGIGKSTLAKIIAGVYPVLTTEDNVKVKVINEKNVCAIMQDAKLFNMSFYQNILLGNAKASREEIMNACDSLGIHAFISGQKEGYDTEVGENGSILSGGIKQRVILARALISGAQTIILDEVTSAIDQESYAKVCECINRYFDEKTLIIITHKELDSLIYDDIINLESV